MVTTTTGSFDFNIGKTSNILNSSTNLAESVTQGIEDQGDLIGTVIGIVIAVTLLIGLIVGIFGLVFVLFSAVSKIKNGAKKIS